MREPFADCLVRGQVAEAIIALWLRRAKGCAVLPVYQLVEKEGKGPQLYSSLENLIAPDMLVFANDVFFVEAKHKSVWTWRYTTNKEHPYPRWQTGIDLPHFRDYGKVQDETGKQVMLLFLHESPSPAAIDKNHDCPANCPVGMFGNPLQWLRKHYDHIDEVSHSHARRGMIYWNHGEHLNLLATIEELEKYK
jgi:hypothetical protein